MKGSNRFPRRLTALLLVSLGAGVASAQLNDTGQQTCYNDSGAVADCDPVAADAGSHPRQDARFGRDAAATAGVLTKTGGGAAGFDFTKVCMSGELAGEGSCPANPSVGTGPNEWACTKDNHTNLVWSLESGYGNWTYATSTYPAAMNVTNRCGYDSDWRPPTRRELLSIVHNGIFNPAIDISYFPNTTSGWYWSADARAPGPANAAWLVDFDNGNTNINSKVLDYHVRLVRSGQ